MKTKEFRKKLEESTDEELARMHRDSIDELFHLRFQLVAGHLEDSSKVRQLKKNMARIKTVILERQRGDFWEKRNLKPPAKKVEQVR